MDPLFNNSTNKKEGSSPFRGNSNTSGNKADAGFSQLPFPNLPKGGGAIKGIDEKFNVNAITGTSSFSIAIPFSPGRNSFAPSFSLSYSSGMGNGAFGIGWQLGIPSITRKTENGLPTYMDADDQDTFILSGAEDLVPVLELQGSVWKKAVQQKTVNGTEYAIISYRPRIEGLFARIEKWQDQSTAEVYWKTTTKDNVTCYYGLTRESRVSDPANDSRVFTWMLCHSHDDKGNIMLLTYKMEDFAGITGKMNEVNRINNCAQIYPKKVLYGNKQAYYAGDAIPVEEDFLFKTIFDYGEHDTAINIPQDIDAEKNVWTCRQDPFSSYRSGFEIRTYRRCCRILMFHCFAEGELPVNPYLVKSLQLYYDETLSLQGDVSVENGFSFLVKARQNGHIWDAALAYYTTKYLPEMELQYQQHAWDTTIQYVTPDNLANAPVGIDDKTYLWVDLYSEGIGGILTEQNNQWYYKSNLGNGQFTHAEAVAPKPSFSGLGTTLSIADLEGNGVKYLVQLDKTSQGFFKMNEDDEWEPMQYFDQFPGIIPSDPNLKFIDLTGDGRSDMLYSNDYQLRWYPSLGEQGFDVSQVMTKAVDEEKGPAIVFADANQSIFLADMSGDGLTDILRIRNGEICYWPNKGYGHFGAKVNMDNPPVFDHSDTFNPAFLRLADIDGSGTTDIIYLGKNDFRVWMNLNGNEWSINPQIIRAFPRIDNIADLAVLDILGTGTASIVYSSYLADQPLQYINLMAGKKPGLLIGYKNNCGKEAAVEYKTSTQYYLDDKLAGIPWVTKLPFPVHCIFKLTATDNIRQTVLVNTFSYRHGYYDFTEKEFRGFARVEQNDTESFSEFVLNNAKNVVEEDLFQPPVKTISWFHTGAYLPNQKLLHQCADEYFQNTAFTEYQIAEPILPVSLSPDEYREALRACKGMPLRTEVYSYDGSPLQLFPYTAAQTNVQIKIVQPQNNNKYASFLVVPSESISYNYERIPADPRISHSFTLETDEFGHVTKSASVVYPRVNRPLGSNAIPDKVWDEQSQMHIVYGESLYTNDIITDDVYRLRVGYESKSYEINGIPQPADFFFSPVVLGPHIDAITTEILFEDEFDGSLQKRLSSHSRLYFYKDDLSGPILLGQLSNLCITYKSYQLAFTKGLVAKYYGAKVTDLMLQDAQYVHSEGDDDWWVQPGEYIFAVDPKSNFYMPIGSRDVFGNESYIEFDVYNLLAIKITDAINNFSTAENDYRMLAPVLVTDPNLNRAASQTDELGFVIKSAIMGKQGAGEGDTLDDPTVKIEYDLFNWQNNAQPNYAHSYSREQHGAANQGWQESYVYSDGGGSIIMTKSQANPGIAKQWDDVGKQVIEVNADPRWIGNGRTIFNNKGNPIKKYDPYFSTTYEYESEDALVETGVTPIMYYDPVGRNIRTELVNGTFSKMVFDSWMAISYDLNDTVMDSQWYIDRGSPDPNGPEPVDPETRAAWLAAKHYNTPGIGYTDSLGRTIYTVADYGNGKTTYVYIETDLTQRYSKVFDQLDHNVTESYVNMLGHSVYSATAEKGERWIFTDVMGRLVKTWDNDLYELYSSYDKLNRVVSTYLNQGNVQTLVSHTVYGDLFSDNDAIGKNIKGAAYQVYDQSGVITVTSIDFKGNPNLANRQLTKDYKQLIDWSVLDGLTDIPTIEATATLLLEDEVFGSAVILDALNRPVTVTLPDNTIIRPTYNEANFLASLDVKIMGIGSFVNFLANQDYDAKGQRQFATYGNNTVTNYLYDPLTFRLVNLITKLKSTDNADQSIQDISYTFDPVGNITQIRDDAQQTHFFNNAVIYPENKYEYDAVYQLIQATGREHNGLVADNQPSNIDLPVIQQLPEANDASAVRNYIEKYDYDNCGNVKQLKHTANNANWARRYQYEYETDATNNTNRLKATSLPGDANGVFSASYIHDLHGNMTSMPHLSAANSMQWNFLDQLNAVNLGGGGNAYYVYSMGGNRTRKVIERQGGLKVERIYLGAVEIYRETQGNNSPKLERYTLHVSDNAGNIAQVDTKTIDTNNSDKINQLNQNNIRYQYGNHLSSAVLETDDSGNVISYEEYHPFGTSSYRVFKPGVDLSLKRYRFSGKERDDESGFYYFGARYYAGWLGRWVSSDPGGFIAGFNLFKYCSNSPVVFHDPNGMEDRTNISIPKSLKGVTDPTAFSAGLRALGFNFTGFNSDGKQAAPDAQGVGHGLAKRSGNSWDVGTWLQKMTPKDDVEEVTVTGPPRAGKDAGSTPPSSGGGVGLGTKSATNNPEGFTLEVPNNFDDGKMDAYRDRITSDRGVGNRSAVPGERRSPKGSDVTDEIRYQNRGLAKNFEDSLQNGRPPGDHIDHSVELQHINRPNGTGGADIVRPQDHRLQDGSTNTSQGSSARAVRDRAVANGAPEDVPAGGVARTRDMGKLTNSENFRTGMRWGGFGLMWAGPFMTAYAAYHSNNGAVRYGGGAVSATEFGAAGYYTYGRFALNGASGMTAGVEAMSIASRVGMGAGGAGAVIFNGYQAIQDFSQGNIGWGVVNTVGAIAGGVMIAAALGLTAPVWGTVAAVVALGVGLAGLARWAFS